MALLAAAWFASAATTAKHKTTKRGHASATHAKTASSAKTTKSSGTLSAKKHSRSRSKGKTTRRTARSYQQHPTQDRYKDIQDALVSKGYFHGEANGQWGPDSADALKRFQADQNLMPDGKISSLSLIALGLGPKRLTAARGGSPTPPQTPTAAPAASQ